MRVNEQEDLADVLHLLSSRVYLNRQHVSTWAGCNEERAVVGRLQPSHEHVADEKLQRNQLKGEQRDGERIQMMMMMMIRGV